MIFFQNYASDIAFGQHFMAPSTFKTQETNNQISRWTEENKMKLYGTKSNYMIVTNVKEYLETRLFLDTNLFKRRRGFSI